MEEGLRIVFMGTPDFAVSSLDALLSNGCNIVGVITATDKWGGRGNKTLIQSAVKIYAQEKGLNILQPKNLKATEFIEELQSLKADLQIVVAFRMLPEIVWNMPPLGTMNLHGSLLPKYRGAAPINWAIINGEKETGVTTFFLKHKIDTGDILFMEKLSIGEEETVGELYDRMKVLGAETIVKSVKTIEEDNYSLLEQNDSEATKAPKIFRETCQINFDQPTQKVFDFIRGLSPYPAAWTDLDGKMLKIFRTQKSTEKIDEIPGKIISDNKLFIKISTKDGSLDILELQLQGKKKMSTQEFLNGYNF